MDDAELKHEIMTKLSVPVPVAGKAFGMGRNSSYEAAKSGSLAGVKVIKVGRKECVPTAGLRKVLGLEPGEPEAE